MTPIGSYIVTSPLPYEPRRDAFGIKIFFLGKLRYSLMENKGSKVLNVGSGYKERSKVVHLVFNFEMVLRRDLTIFLLPLLVSRLFHRL
jgi:hypothetical protein